MSEQADIGVGREQRIALDAVPLHRNEETGGELGAGSSCRQPRHHHDFEVEKCGSWNCEHRLCLMCLTCVKHGGRRVREVLFAHEIICLNDALHVALQTNDAEKRLKM